MYVEVGSLLRVVQADDDCLRGDVKPFVLDSGLDRRLGELLKVGALSMRWGQRLGALQHHVQQRLDVHDLVLEAQPDGTPHGPDDVLLSILVQGDEPGPDALLVREDVLHMRPLAGDLGVLVTELRVVDVRVDAPLEDGVVRRGIGGRRASSLGELDVQEGGDVSQIEDTGVAELDGLLVKVLVWEHAPGDDLPSGPQGGPVVDGGESVCSVQGRVQREIKGFFAEHVDA